MRTDILCRSNRRERRWPQRLIRSSLHIIWLLILFRALASSAASQPEKVKLPPHVAEMRELILAAVRSGNIEDLRPAIEWNELKPDLGDGTATDPIKALLALSADLGGRDLLAALGEAIDAGPVALPLGSDLENNLIYVWPYLAEKPLDKLTSAEQVDLYRLVPPPIVDSMREKKRWTWWRLAIGADGTWHSFKKTE